MSDEKHAASSRTALLTPSSDAVSSAAPGHYPACGLSGAPASTCSWVPEPGESHRSLGCPALMGGPAEGWEAGGTALGTDFDLRAYLQFSWLSPVVKENKKVFI